MKDIVKLEIPVNYVKKQEDYVLLYSTIEIEKKKVPKYKNYCEIIKAIFDDSNGNLEFIGNKIGKIINKSYQDSSLLQFIMENEWILRFAFRKHIDQILQNKNFVVSYKTVETPYDAYINGQYQIIFTKKEQVPVWDAPKKEYYNLLIEWLITDKYNTYNERLSALLLGNRNNALGLIKDNLWLLMKTDELMRIDIMKKMGINYVTIDKVVGCDIKRNIIRQQTTIPKQLVSKYEKMNQEIKQILVKDNIEDYLVQYAYNHSPFACVNDENELLRDNLWLLNFLDLNMQLQLLELLEIRGSSTKSNNYKIDKEIYNQLKNELFTILYNNDDCRQLEIEKLIERDRRVLIIWPWLSCYIDNNLNDKNIKKET